ncbi:pre-peptidase C-terminal domain-containing protein [Microcoleus sp. FACHB-1515]|uniref:cadherin-like domain-containing protein n=1 Tax=Cyanophyceae TaxID=3028117 RepID=UPI0016835353|nr:cadherin-like domain-containing protein [Microcoleus sp. FACHB-1515]MBD2091747.1 pre-peptidase C-terminal domain-containing protein [Microcoleus sp. FACHB-1515]
MARDSGNRLNQARSLTIAARRKQLSETIGAGDPADFFRFRLSDRRSTSFSLSQLRDNADLALLNNRGRVISQSRRPGNRTEQINRTLEAGVYYLRVTPRARQDSTRYQLRYSAATPSPSPTPTPTPGNTNPTIASSGISVIRGTTATLNSSLLSATDAEQPTSNLVYTLTTLPQSGSLLFNNEAITAPGRTFTQADIAAGRLTYTNRGSSRPLATTTTLNRNPQISGSNVVWEGNEDGDFEIIYSDGSTRRSLTNNSVNDLNPQISGSNVVWQEGTGSSARILLLQGIDNPASTTPTPLSLATSTDNRAPVISGTNVAWSGRGGVDSGNDFEIFFWNGTQVQQLTNNDTDDVNVRISGSNLVWQNENVGVADSEIFFWNGTQVQQITNNSTDDQLPQISGSNIVWQGVADNNFEIFFSNGGANPPVRLTTNTTNDLNPQISGSNVVWQNTVGSTSTIFFTAVGNAPTAPIALSPATGFANNPQISGSNIVWRGAATASSSLELFFTDSPGTSLIQLTSNSSASNVTPSISGGNVVWTRSTSPNLTTSQVFLISAARQDSFGFTVTDGAGGSTNGTFNFTIG